MNAVKDFFARLFGTHAAARVLSVEERFNGASAVSAQALSTFDLILDDLDAANVDLQAVETEVAAEVARLSELAASAARQAGHNSAVAANVRRLIQPPVTPEV